MIYQIIALVIMALFYGCYFIKMFSQRKKGIQTDLLGKGKTGFVRFVEITTKIATYLAAAAELASIALGASLLPSWTAVCGAVIGFAGTAVFICAVLTMRDSWRAGVPENEHTELVTSGIFSVSRNPAFLGFDLVYIGILLMFFNWVLFAVSAFSVLMLHLQIVNVEEDFLLCTFGDAYIEYRGKVRRYFGRKAVRAERGGSQ